MSEMMKAYDRLNAALQQRLKHSPIALQCLRVEAILLRLDSAPFHREPKSVQAEFPGKVEIGLGVIPPVTGLTTAVS
jgi:hypothetical protein